jgi:hypothetical protein
MILSPDQLNALQQGEAVPLTVEELADQEYVIVRTDFYDRLNHALYDDSPWSNEEMEEISEADVRAAKRVRKNNVTLGPRNTWVFWLNLCQDFCGPA